MSKDFMSIEVKIIPHKEQTFTTIGYWTMNKLGAIVIYVSKMADWRFTFAVLCHELFEVAWCKWKGVSQREADTWDAEYEAMYQSGEKSLTEEPGDNPLCCYYGGHQWGCWIEWAVIHALGASWSDYLADCDRLMGTEYNPK